MAYADGTDIRTQRRVDTADVMTLSSIANRISPVVMLSKSADGVVCVTTHAIRTAIKSVNDKHRNMEILLSVK